MSPLVALTLFFFSEQLACELLLVQQNMEVMLHGLGVQPNEDLGDLRLPFAVAAHLSPNGCRFMALSPDENERGVRPCICLARIPWTECDHILTGFAHIVVCHSCCIQRTLSHALSHKACGKRFWSTVNAAVMLNRPALPVPLPPSPPRLEKLHVEIVRVRARSSESDDNSADEGDEDDDSE